jgi:hypothetical protein
MFDLRPLRSATFRHLAAAYWVNEFGNWIGEIALTILVYDRTRSPLETAALFLSMRFLPALLAPLVTIRVEAMHTRRVLTIAYLLEAAFFAGMAGVAERFSLPALFILCVLDGALAITAKALTRSATANLLLQQDMLREGNGILNLGAMASLAGAPMIAAVLVAWKGAQNALLVDVGTFLLTALIVVSAGGIYVESDRAAGFSGRLRSGLDVLRQRSVIRRLFYAVGLTMLLGAVPIPIEVVFAKHTLHAGDYGYGVLLGAWGCGMVIGGTIFATAKETRLVAVFIVGTLLTALGYGALAAAPTLALACAGSAIGGLGNGGSWVAAVTAVQERIPIDTQSAVMAVLESMNQMLPALGFVVGGVVTALASPRTAYAIAAGGVALVVVAFTVRPIDRIPLDAPLALPTGEVGHRDLKDPGASARSSASPTITIG